MYDVTTNQLFLEKYKRVEDALNFKKTDRIPYVDWVQHAGVIEHYSYASSKENFWTLDQIYEFAKNALDMNQDHTPAYTPDSFFPTPQDINGVFDLEMAEKSIKILERKEKTWILEDGDGFIWEYDYWNRWILKYPYNDYQGALKLLQKKTEEIQYFIDSLDWKKYVPEFQSAYADAVKKSSTPCFYLTPFGGLGFDILYLLVGWDYLPDMLYSDEIEIIKKYVNCCVELAVTWIEKAVDKKFSPMGLIYSDIAFNSGLMFSPQMLEEILGDGIARLTSAYHKHDIKVIYHSEGDIKKFIPCLIKNGVDGINPLEQYADMEIIQTRKRYPDLILWGGVDNGQTLLPNGTPDEVEKYIRHVIKEIGQDGGLMLSSSGQVHPGCKKENVIAMIETLKKLHL